VNRIPLGPFIWAAALLLYGGFLLWYTNLRGPLTPAEIATYSERLGAVSHLDPERRAILRDFLESDDGGEFFMVNLIRMHEGEVEAPGSSERAPAAQVLESYTGEFMPALFLRAGHPVFAGPAVGRYVEHWGVEPDPGWTFAAVIRYRSRRDLVELVVDPAFEPAHRYKLAAIANTLAFPVAPARAFVGPRVWVGLVLGLLAALTHLAVRSRRGWPAPGSGAGSGAGAGAGAGERER